MKLATKNSLGLLCVLGVTGLGCGGGQGSSGPIGGNGQSVQGGSFSAGGVVSGGVPSAGGTGAKAGTGAAVGSGGAFGGGGSTNMGGTSTIIGSGGSVIGKGGTANTGGASTIIGSGGSLGGGMTSGGANAGGRSSVTGGTPASGGVTVATGGSPGLGGTSGNTTAGTGGAKGGTGGSGGNTNAGTGGTKVGSGASGGMTAASGGSAGTTAGSVTIVPGAVWNDTQGNVIQAHGEGIIKVGGTYYWLGEDKTNGSSFQNVKCYSSTDLKNWTFVNNALTRQASGDLGQNRIIERPHVIYNSLTSQYVMYMHVDNSSYTDRKAGVATCSSVCGSYTYQGSVKPLGHDSLDDTLFQDGTTGYFISEDRTNTKLQIYQLSDDYLTVSSLVASLPQFESPAVAKIGSTYFIFGSHLTGWSTNDNQYTTASSMVGPWAAWKSFAPSGTNTCDSQVTFILPVTGTSTTTYVFLGDRWNSGNLTDSRYIWQPLTINGTAVSMTCATSWKIDTSTGISSP
jgi:hypothetical protein